MMIFIVTLAIVLLFIIAGAAQKNKGSNIPDSNEDLKARKLGLDNLLATLYLPQNIQRSALQTLETVHIIATSNTIDTIKGRYAFLMEVVEPLKSNEAHSRYLADIQRAIELYKCSYYDRIIQDYELAILLKPTNFNLADFYCNCLIVALKRIYNNHLEEIKLLKREDAKIRRKNKLIEIFNLIKEELQNNCSSTPSYSASINEIATLEPLIFQQAGGIEIIETVGIQQFASFPNQPVKGIKSQKTTAETEFLLNPGAIFEMTLLGADEFLGGQIKSLLSDDNLRDDQRRQIIVSFFAEYNLKVKEVEQYKVNYGKVYFNKLEELKRTSKEWDIASALDKEDLLNDFRPIALREIYERANCDLITLFEKEPADITIDDALIGAFGFDNLQTYLRFANDIDKVRVISNDSYNRPRFEKLVDLGLAIRGSQIQTNEILSTLTLKDLNEIANSSKQFKRKNQAIEFIMTLPEPEEKISSKITLRELFKLQPLPPKFNQLNLKEISDTWSYTTEVVNLLINTYRSSRYVTQMLEDNKDSEYVKEYKVECWAPEESFCPCAKNLTSNTYPKNHPPQVPFHIGCDCQVRQEVQLT